MDPVTLAGERVLLRAPTPTDAETITAAIQDQEIPHWIDVIPWPYTREDAHHFIQQIAGPGWANGENPIWLVTDRSSQEVWGSVGLTKRLAGVYEVGFWLTPSRRGQGLMAESVRLVCKHAFDALGAQRIEWQAVVGNVASRRVAERLGFTFEGRSRARLRQGDRSVDVWVASLLPGEPMAAVRDRLVPMEPVPVVGPLVDLRPPGPELTGWVEAAYRDPAIQQWNPGHVTDSTTAADWLCHRADWASGDHVSWIFCEPHGGKPVGSVSIHKVNQDNLSAAIGYWTHPDERGRGMASAAVQLATSWAMDQLRLKRLELIHAVVNPASCKVAERAGFELEGTVRLGERYGDKQWYDEHIHGRVNP